LKDQTVYGIRNAGQVLNIHNLKSENAVPAIYSTYGGLITLVDATLTGKAGASALPAIDTPTARLVARDITTMGYKIAIHAQNSDFVEPTVSEFVSDPVQSLFSSSNRTLNLPIRDTPTVPWEDPKSWANVVSYGAIPNDGKDDTAAIQAAIDSGKSTIYFPATGTFEIEGTILVRNNVRRILGTEGKVRALSNMASFKVVDGTSPTVVIERMANGFDFPLTIENASSRTLVLKDLSDVTGNMTGNGDVFIEDVVGGNWRFGKQNIWARQLNVENKGTHITNDGGNLWILGLKTEQGGTIIDTKNGGKTELLGGLIYNTNNAPNGAQDEPMFIDSESSTSFTFSEVNFGGGSEYTTYVRETQGGITKDLSGANLLSSNAPYGKSVPLYVGYP
ncbi:MAG TPA: glycosyl hydrolase family 28-related protein, partial [Coleofasciculaceae cyanobacterium]